MKSFTLKVSKYQNDNREFMAGVLISALKNLNIKMFSDYDFNLGKFHIEKDGEDFILHFSEYE